MKLETAPELDLDEAELLKSNSHSSNIKQNSLHCKPRGVQDHNKYAVGHYKNHLEDNEIKYGVDCSFRSIRHEFSVVKQKKIVLITFDDNSCYFYIYNSVQ